MKYFCRYVVLLPIVLSFAACGGGGGGTITPPPPPPSTLLLGADPHVAIFGDRYWIYRTSTAAGGPGELYAYVADTVSNDTNDWVRQGPILSLSDIAWVNDDGAPVHYLWAPAIHEDAGTYYLYYSIGPQDPTPSRIGVAIADNPAGPFVDSGAPILTGDASFEAIDPMVFVEPTTNTRYLYAGGSAGATLRLFELSPNLVDIDQEFMIDQPQNFTEAPFIHIQDGVYYLTYSNGRWNEDSYSVHYSIGASPTGPWTYCGVLVETDATRKGPGHNSVLQDRDDPAIWHLVHHQWDSSFTVPPYSGDRHIVFETVDLSIQPCP